MRQVNLRLPVSGNAGFPLPNLLRTAHFLRADLTDLFVTETINQFIAWCSLGKTIYDEEGFGEGQVGIRGLSRGPFARVSVARSKMSA